MFGTGYSLLNLITTQSVGGLALAWSYRLQSDPAPAAADGPGGRGRSPNSEATSIVVYGAMYLPAADRVVALEPESGKTIRTYPVAGGAPSRRALRIGQGTSAIRLAFSSRLVALNANTSKIDPRFGKKGQLDMVVPYNSVPLIYKNVVVGGANTPPGPIGAPGNAHAFDTRTGAELWEFSSVAQPGHDTWEGDSWKDRSGVNA